MFDLLTDTGIMDTSIGFTMTEINFIRIKIMATELILFFHMAHIIGVIVATCYYYYESLIIAELQLL